MRNTCIDVSVLVPPGYTPLSAADFEALNREGIAVGNEPVDDAPIFGFDNETEDLYGAVTVSLVNAESLELISKEWIEAYMIHMERSSRGNKFLEIERDTLDIAGKPFFRMKAHYVNQDMMTLAWADVFSRIELGKRLVIQTVSSDSAENMRLVSTVQTLIFE